MLLWQGDDSDPEPEAYIDGYSYDDLSDSSSSYYYGSESLDLTGSQSADPEPTSYDFYGVSANNYPLYQTQGKDIKVMEVINFPYKNLNLKWQMSKNKYFKVLSMILQRIPSHHLIQSLLPTTVSQ